MKATLKTQTVFFMIAFAFSVQAEPVGIEQAGGVPIEHPIKLSAFEDALNKDLRPCLGPLHAMNLKNNNSLPPYVNDARIDSHGVFMGVQKHQANPDHWSTVGIYTYLDPKGRITKLQLDDETLSNYNKYPGYVQIVDMVTERLKVCPFNNVTAFDHTKWKRFLVTFDP